MAFASAERERGWLRMLFLRCGDEEEVVRHARNLGFKRIDPTQLIFEDPKYRITVTIEESVLVEPLKMKS